MHGLRGLAGWQWLYAIEGALTILIGIGSFFVIADRHESATYLTERQHFLMRVRAAKSAAYTRDDGFVWADFKKHASDPMIYLSGFVLLCMDVCMYGFVSTDQATERSEVASVWECACATCGAPHLLSHSSSPPSHRLTRH